MPTTYASVWVGSDETVIAGMADGETGAAAELIRRYQRRVFGLAATILGAGPEAEDVTQETFLRVWRHARLFDARRARASTWVLSIARHAAIDVARSRRPDLVDPDAMAALGLIDTGGGPEDAAVAETELVRVRAALGRLPGNQCEALVAASLLGLTAVEIARAQGVPVGTVKSRIRAGLRQTRDLLRETEAVG
jgi:RNA polymerase sigma factor (sigma-70 family)